MNIEGAIDKQIQMNKDKGLSIENLVCIALEKFPTSKLFEYYAKHHEIDIRYILERKITDMYLRKLRQGG